MLIKNIIVILIAFISSRTSAEIHSAVTASEVNCSKPELYLYKNLSRLEVFVDTRIKVSSPQQFRYLTVETKGCFNAWVKTDSEVQISLSNSAQYNDPRVKIIIGGWNNTVSAVVINEDYKNALKINTPAIIKKNEFQGFSVRWSTTGDIRVGRIYEYPFLVYNYTENWYPINFVGVAHHRSGKGSWLINGDGRRCF